MTVPADWRVIAVPPETRLDQALSVLERTGAGILIVIDETTRLLGTLTDGDVRRALLRGDPLSVQAKVVMNPSPACVPEGVSRQSAQSIFTRLSIDALPVVAPSGAVIDVFFASGANLRTQRSSPVLLLAGGKGTRLGSLTATTPKPLLKIAGVPILEALTRRLINQGFVNVWIAVHHMAGTIMDHFADGKHLGATINYLVEPEPLGTAGSLRLLAQAKEEPVLVVNGDLVSDTDFAGLLDVHLRSAAQATVGVFLHESTVPYGVVVHEDADVQDILEKPMRQDWVSAGINVIGPRVAELVPDFGPCEMPDLLRSAIQMGLRVKMAPIGAYWTDIGTPMTYRAGLRDHLDRHMEMEF